MTDCKGTDTDIVIPSHHQGLPVVEIGDEAFSSASITSVIMPDSVTRIGTQAFNSCSKLASVTFSKNLATIGDYAFYGTSFTSLILPSSLTEVGTSAFENCGSNVNNVRDGYNYLPSESNPYFLLVGPVSTSISSASIAADVELICGGVFNDCRNLTSFSVDSASTRFSTDGKALFNQDKTALVCYACGAGTTYTIPATVTAIRGYAFESCSSLTSVIFPSALISIGNYAFDSSGLAAVEFPSTLTSIGEGAFTFCQIASLVLPSAVASIGEAAFIGCALSSISVDAANVSFVSDGKALYNKNKTEIIQYAIGSADTSYTLPDSLTKIGMGAFGGATSLTSITLPDSLVKIGMEAFIYCVALTSIALPKSVVSLGKQVFLHDQALASITVDPANVNFAGDGKALYNKDKTEILQYAIGLKDTSYELPATLTTIDPRAFYGAKALTSLTLPSSLTSIGDSAFYNCMGLTTLTYLGSKADWAKVSLGVSWNVNSSIKSITCNDGTITL